MSIMIKRRLRVCLFIVLACGSCVPLTGGSDNSGVTGSKAKGYAQVCIQLGGQKTWSCFTPQ